MTQKSLLDAAKGSSSGKKTSSASSAAKSSMKVTATEKRLVELYRAADASTKKAALKLLRGGEGEGLLESFLGGALDALAGKRTLPGEPEEDGPEEE